MRRMIIAILVFSFLLTGSPWCAACEKTEQLFWIEHSKNKNAVHYEACLDKDGLLSNSEPVIAYWLLEDGRREDLSGIERGHAYGVVLRERQGREKILISVVSLKVKEITVEKIGQGYAALIPIDGKECILERVYLKSHDLPLGLAVVEYIDFFGKTREGGHPVSEHVDRSALNP